MKESTMMQGTEQQPGRRTNRTTIDEAALQGSEQHNRHPMRRALAVVALAAAATGGVIYAANNPQSGPKKPTTVEAGIDPNWVNSLDGELKEKVGELNSQAQQVVMHIAGEVVSYANGKTKEGYDVSKLVQENLDGTQTVTVFLNSNTGEDTFPNGHLELSATMQAGVDGQYDLASTTQASFSRYMNVQGPNSPLHMLDISYFELPDQGTDTENWVFTSVTNNISADRGQSQYDLNRIGKTLTSKPLSNVLYDATIAMSEVEFDLLAALAESNKA